MYDYNLKGERILAQIKAIGGLNFGFNKHINKLKEIIYDEEDIFGYLVGYNEESKKWEIVLCTTDSIYVLNKNKLFSVGYQEFTVSSFRGLTAESNMFRKYKVTINLGKEQFHYTECQRSYVDLFRIAVNNAKSKGNLPYEFDKTPFLIKEKNTGNSFQEDFEDDIDEQPYFEQKTSKLESRNEEARRRKEHIENYLAQTKEKYQNVYFYPEREGDGYHSDGTLDSSYQDYFDTFVETVGIEPEYTDFSFLKDNHEAIHSFIEKGEIYNAFNLGRRGSLYKLKEKYGMDVNSSDFVTNSDYMKYLETLLDEDYVPRSEKIDNNHIANRFLQDSFVDELEIESPEEEDEDDEVDFDIDFSKLSSIQEEQEEVEQEVNLQESPSNKNDDLYTIQENGKTKMFNLLNEYKVLYDMGILTQKEFDEKKREILDS